MQGGQGVDCDNLPPIPGAETEEDSADSVETVDLAASASDTTGPLASYSGGAAAGTAAGAAAGAGGGPGGTAGAGQKGSPIPWAPYQQQQQAPGDAAAAGDGDDDGGEDVDTKIEQLRAVAELLLDKAEELEQRL